MTDATACIDRLEFNDEPDGTVATSGAFTFTFNDSPDGQTVTVEFDLTGTGQVVCGFSVKGGNTTNFFTVAEDQGTVGSFVLNAPVNSSGGFANISNIDVFCCPGNGTNVPDGGTTVMLLGSALTGLGIMRRYIKS